MLQNLERKPIRQLLLQYSLPAVIGMAATSAYNLIDAMYVGQWCSPYAVAALALVFPVMNLTVAAGTLVGLGAAANISIILGQQDYDRAFRVMGTCMILGLIVGILVGWVPCLWLREILQFFGAEGKALDEAYDFLLVIMLGFPISTNFMNLNHLMRASGYPKKAMMSLLITMVVNIAVAPILMLGFNMGVMGAALATVLAQCAGFVWVCAHYCNRRSVLHFKRGIYKLNGVIVRRILAVGLAPCLLNIVGCVVVVVFNHMFLAYEGQMGVGAFGVVNRTMFFFVMVVLGIAQGMQPIVGYNLGMGQFSRVRRALKLAMLCGISVTTLGFLLVQIFPREILECFADDSSGGEASRLIQLGTDGIRLYSLFFPLVGIQIVSFNFFQAISKPVMSIFLGLTRQLIFLLPCLLILPHFWGEKGIWLTQAAADLMSISLSFVILTLYIRRHLPKKDVCFDR